MACTPSRSLRAGPCSVPDTSHPPAQSLYTQHTRSSPPRLYASTSGTASEKASLIAGPHFLQLCRQALMSLHPVQVRASGSAIKKNPQESQSLGFSGQMPGSSSPRVGTVQPAQGFLFHLEPVPQRGNARKCGVKACVSCFSKCQGSSSGGRILL